MHSSTTLILKNPGQAGRLELAIQVVQIGQITSVRKAARLYDVLFSTLQQRVYSIQQLSIANRTKRKLI